VAWAKMSQIRRTMLPLLLELDFWLA